MASEGGDTMPSLRDRLPTIGNSQRIPPVMVGTKLIYPFPIFSLPQEIILEVLSNVSGTELLTLLSISKDFVPIISDNDELWKKVYLEDSVEWTWLHCVHVDPALDYEQKYLAQHMNQRMLDHEWRLRLPSYKKIPSASPRASASVHPMTTTRDGFIPIKNGRHGDRVLDPAMLGPSHSNVTNLTGHSAISAVRRLHDASQPLALVGLNSSQHWVLLNTLMWGPPDRRWLVNGLYSSRGAGIGAGVGFDAFGQNINIRAIKYAHMFAMQDGVTDASIRWMDFLGESSGIVIVVTAEQTADVHADTQSKLRYLFGLLTDQRAPRRHGGTAPVLILATSRHNYESDDDHRGPGGVGVPNHQAPPDPEPPRNYDPVERGSAKSGHHINLAKLATDLDLATLTAEANSRSNHTKIEWGLFECDSLTLTGVNEGMMWLLSRV